MASPTYYDLLQVSLAASDAAYKALSRMHHPANNVGR